MIERPSVVVVAAWEPELESFREFISEYIASCSKDLHVAAVGIGLVDATAGTTRALSRHGAVEHVVLLGTCGASPRSGLAVGDVVVGTSVRLVDPASVEGRAAMPFAGEPIALDHEVAGARPATVANTLGVTTDDALAERLAPLGDVEHLEAYGVARACQLASVRCTVVLGVANAVGSRGRAEWRAHHVEASARAAQAAWAWLRTSTTRRSPG